MVRSTGPNSDAWSFNDPEALQQLEAIVHPLVEQAVDIMIKRAGQLVIVVEAIKLLEGKLAAGCDSIWVVVAPEAVQKTRLIQKRKMSEKDALQRIHAQPDQEIKTAAAKVVIQNSGSFEDTWKQVVAAWKIVSPVPTPARWSTAKPLMASYRCSAGARAIRPISRL